MMKSTYVCIVRSISHGTAMFRVFAGVCIHMHSTGTPHGIRSVQSNMARTMTLFGSCYYIFSVLKLRHVGVYCVPQSSLIQCGGSTQTRNEIYWHNNTLIFPYTTLVIIHVHLLYTVTTFLNARAQTHHKRILPPSTSSFHSSSALAKCCLPSDTLTMNNARFFQLFYSPKMNHFHQWGNAQAPNETCCQ